MKGNVGVSSHWTNKTRRLDGSETAYIDAARSGNPDAAVAVNAGNREQL